jgi:hypothetical protein
MSIEFPLSNVRSLPSAAAPGAFSFRCLFFLRVILQQLSVALQLPFRGDVSLSTRCEAAHGLLCHNLRRRNREENYVLLSCGLEAVT